MVCLFGPQICLPSEGGPRVLLSEDFQDRLACIGADVPWMEDPSLIHVCNPLDGLEELPLEHQAVKYLRTVLWGMFSPAGG